jgi:hypothetical protein
MGVGECSMNTNDERTMLEVEIAWLEKDLNNAEQNDNEPMVYNLTKRVETLYKKLNELKNSS